MDWSWPTSSDDHSIACDELLIEGGMLIWDPQEDTYPDDIDADNNVNLLLVEESEKETEEASMEESTSFTTSSLLAKPCNDREGSTVLAGWNISSLIQGSGILAIPYAVKQGGWAAVAMLFFVALVSCHTGKLLIECMYEKSKRTGLSKRLRASYPEIAEAVMGRKGFILVGIMQSIEVFGVAIINVVLLGTAWADILRPLTGLGMKEWAAINCCVALPSLFITKMSVVAWFSMLSVFSLISTILALLSFCFSQVQQWSLANIPVFEPRTFPIGFGVIVLSYCGHPILPYVEGSMKKPQKFNLVMNLSFLFAALTKAVLGTFMVLKFGDKTVDVATVNLRNHPVFSKVATGSIIASVLLDVPLIMFVINVAFDETFLKYFPHLKKDSKYHWLWLLMTRPLLLCFVLFLGIMVPHFGLLIGVSGSFTGTFLVFLFPCIFHMKLKKLTMKRWEFFVDVFIILFGVVAGGLGLFFSMKSLVLTYL